MRNSVINNYNKLKDEQQELMDKMSNLGREKDYKVQKIEKKYQSQIDCLTREQEALAIQIDSVEKYINRVAKENNNFISNQIKK